jgi:hypothetical protein
MGSGAPTGRAKQECVYRAIQAELERVRADLASGELQTEPGVAMLSQADFESLANYSESRADIPALLIAAWQVWEPDAPRGKSIGTRERFTATGAATHRERLDQENERRRLTHMEEREAREEAASAVRGERPRTIRYPTFFRFHKAHKGQPRPNIRRGTLQAIDLSFDLPEHIGGTIRTDLG